MNFVWVLVSRVGHSVAVKADILESNLAYLKASMHTCFQVCILKYAYLHAYLKADIYKKKSRSYVKLYHTRILELLGEQLSASLQNLEQHFWSSGLWWRCLESVISISRVSLIQQCYCCNSHVHIFLIFKGCIWQDKRFIDVAFMNENVVLTNC